MICLQRECGISVLRMNSTFQHDYNEIDVTRKRFKVRDVYVFKLYGEKIQEDTMYFGVFDPLSQICAIHL
jgi:hypothetical protein